MGFAKLHILGSGSALPYKDRSHSSQLLELQDKQFLIDCGEGTQMHLWHLRGIMTRMNNVFISHLHGDHCLGLMGLLSSLDMLGRTAVLNIYSPPGLEELLVPQLAFFCPDCHYEIKFHAFLPYKSAVIYEDRGLTVRTLPLKHKVPACGFLFEEKAKERHIVREMVEAYGVPVAWMPRLKQGEDYVSEDGTVVSNERLTSDADRSWRYAYCSDTEPNEKIVPLIAGVDVLYHEATFAVQESARAKETNHSTSVGAATLAREACVGRLLIGHFSSRYKEIDSLLEEARSVFPNTDAVHDDECFDF